MNKLLLQAILLAVVIACQPNLAPETKSSKTGETTRQGATASEQDNDNSNEPDNANQATKEQPYDQQAATPGNVTGVFLVWRVVSDEDQFSLTVDTNVKYVAGKYSSLKSPPDNAIPGVGLIKFTDESGQNVPSEQRPGPFPNTVEMTTSSRATTATDTADGQVFGLEFAPALNSDKPTNTNSSPNSNKNRRKNRTR